MKVSQFNSYIPYQNKYVIYNAFSNEFLLLEPLLHDLIQASINEDSVEKLQSIHKDLYNVLEEKGFIVTKETDELQKVKDLRDSVDFDESSFHLFINPTMNCNFKCWYCYETHIKSSKMSDEIIVKTRELIVKNVVKNKKVQRFILSWFGGEPLLYFEKTVLPILSFAHKISSDRDVQFYCDFTTNGYLINEEMIESFKKYGVSSFQITLDGNEEKHNKVRFVSKSRGSYKEIIHNIKLLCTNQFKVAVRINYTKDNLDGLELIKNDFDKFTLEERKYMTFSFHRVWQETLDCKDNLEVVTQNLLSSGFNVATDYSTDTVRNSCYADRKNQVTLNYNGEIFKCTARDFTSENKEGILKDGGEIDWNERFQERMNSKFKNKPCLSCQILPICNGGCSQAALENIGKDYCVVEDNGKKKDDIVMAKFFETMQSMTVI